MKTTKKIPILKFIVFAVFLAFIFIGPLWMLLADIEPAPTLNNFQAEMLNGNYFLPVTYILLMFCFALTGFFIIVFIKWFWAIATGKNDTATSQLFKAVIPKKMFNIFFSSRKIDLSQSERENFPDKIIINVAFGNARIVLPVNITFEIKGDNIFGKTFFTTKRTIKEKNLNTCYHQAKMK